MTNRVLGATCWVLRASCVVLGAACVVLGASACGVAGAAPARGTGSDARVPVVVELFTSEGCSSCPPADALLKELLAKQPVSGALVIGLSEHVDYWDQLGWRDPFSDARFTDRQRHYSATVPAEVYTPQMIVNGTSAFVGSDRDEAMRAIADAAVHPIAPVTLVWSPSSPSHLEVTVTHATPNDEVLLAIVEDGLSSAVKRGENAGRTIAHAAVTRRLQTIGTTDRTGGFHATVAAPADAAWRTSALTAVVIVQRRNQGAIDAAATLAWTK